MNLSDMKQKLSVMKSLNTTSLVIEKENYEKPSLSLLKTYRKKQQKSRINSHDLEQKLSDFGFETSVEDIKVGPMITRYELKLSRGVKLSQIRGVAEDLALAMSGNIRILAPVPGTNFVGVESSNNNQSIIGLKKIISKTDKKEKLPIPLGTDITGEPKIIDLAKMPHLLVAGQTGSGKSVFINNIILSILYTKTPDECEMVLVDPKRVEMAAYGDMPHLRCPVVTEPEDAVGVFNDLINEMERRYDILSEYKVRNIESYNKIGHTHMPYIVTIVDEMADLMMTSGKELESMIVRLAQLARAVGIHLVLATQKPIVKVITGLIKSNMPSRISFKVASKTDSRVILDCNGAEQLIGRGDMLMVGPGYPEPERFHGAWVSDEEIHSIVNFIKG